MFLPTTCAGCGQVGGALCDRCRATLRPAPRLEPPHGVDLAIALVLYEGVAAAAIRDAKFHHRRAAFGQLADALATMVAAHLGDAALDPRGAAVTWVPALSSHRRRRGFDQGRLIAGRVSRASGVGHRPLLDRRDRHAQLGLDRLARLAGPHLTARAGVPTTVIVVDDVRTTGASMRCAAGALRAGGAEIIVAATIAATPHHPR